MSADAFVPAHIVALPVEPRARRLVRRFGWSAGVVLEVAAIIGLWQFIVDGLHLGNPDFVPPPSEIWAALARLAGTGVLAANLGFSVGNFVGGYLLAATCGVGVGLAMGMSPFVNTALGPFVWTLYATPRIVIAPLLVIWFGFGSPSKIAVIFLLAFFPILLNVLVGVREVDRQLLRAGAIFGAGRWDLVVKVVLPSILPYTLTGLRLGVGRGLIGVVIGEFIGSAAGLGYLIVRSSARFDLAESLAICAVLLVMANLSMAALELARRRIAPWYRESGLL